MQVRLSSEVDREATDPQTPTTPPHGPSEASEHLPEMHVEQVQSNCRLSLSRMCLRRDGMQAGVLGPTTDLGRACRPSAAQLSWPRAPPG